MKRTVLKVLVMAAVAAAVISCGRKPREKGAGEQLVATVDTRVHPVKVVEATSRDVRQEGVYSATVEAYAVNNIAPQSASRIRKINVEVGDYVHRGQVVAEMDRLQLDQARLQLINDSTEFERLKKLYASGGIAKSDLDAVELAYNVRRSTVDNLETNTILRSPISGYITARNYDKGDLFAMAQPLFVVQQVIPVKLIEVDRTGGRLSLSYIDAIDPDGEDKTPRRPAANIHWIIKKARELQKNIFFD